MRQSNPADCARQHWDAIVVGTGMGGAAFGWALARAGRRVLFCEQGLEPDHAHSLRGDYAESLVASPVLSREQLSRAGRWSETLYDVSPAADPASAVRSGKAAPCVPFIGAGSGGSTALYGMVLERFQPHDFDAVDLTTPTGALPRRWPFSYADLQPYYRLAEQCFGLRGEADPLRRDPPAVTPPQPASPAAAELRAHLAQRGLHPYAPPLACRLRPGCRGCQGYLCAQDCKRDSATTFLAPAVQTHDAILLGQTRALRLDSDMNRITGLVVEHQGREYRLQADIYALGAGALSTPRLLLASHNRHWPRGVANRSGLVGRGLMRHLIDLYAITTQHDAAATGNLKELAFNDWYNAETGLGSVQSFGALPPPPVLAADLLEDLAARSGIHRLSHSAWLHRLFTPLTGLGTQSLRRATILASTLEDYAYPDNQLSLNRAGDLQLAYRLREADQARVHRFRQRLREALSPYRYKLIRQADSNKRLAHVCGTCRLGNDADSGVIDAGHRAYGLENLFVIDGAALPVSGGTNPGLTICATALRAADGLLGGSLCQSSASASTTASTPDQPEPNA